MEVHNYVVIVATVILMATSSLGITQNPEGHPREVGEKTKEEEDWSEEEGRR